MRERVCNNCGGRKYKVVGQNMVKCMFCGSLYVDENSSKEEEVLVALANQLVREFKFDEALAKFDEIIGLYPYSYQGYFGRALAKNKILMLSNRRGTSKRPRFYGENICSIAQEPDFLKAVELAPPEEAKIFTDCAKRIERIKKTYESTTSKKVYDVVFCVLGEKDEKTIALHDRVCELLNKLELSCYDLLSIAPKESEEETFRALETSKIFITLALSGSGFAELRHIIERYVVKISKRQKTSTSFVLLTQAGANITKTSPLFQNCKSAFDVNSTSFLQDLEAFLKQEVKNSINQTAKIETVALKKVAPKKKEYADVESISPSELGHYNIENVDITDEGRIKWLFLALKNGDFQTASKLVEEELQKNPYSSELLFAKLLCEKKIKTKEEFFSKIGNFSDKEAVFQILRYASKDFAEDFVDRWEKLIQDVDALEYYNAYILDLAAYLSPGREQFISAAADKAVETLDEELIDKVTKCFNRNDVERFINFYFLLAQKSDKKEYYNKILELDAGHEQSNIALLMTKFKSIKDILTYRNKDELESSLKYVDSKGREAFVSAVVNKILPVAFFDLEEAQKQIDFYLSYMPDDESLGELCCLIAQDFQERQFFKPAEKYITIAISKNKQKAELYWQLIKIKCHCRSDQDLIMSKVKVDQMPEWGTLLEVGDEAHDELYAGIVSHANLYKGEKEDILPDFLDKKTIMEKLNDFLLRNDKILLELEKQEGLSFKVGIDYYRLQLKPFQKNLLQLKECRDFESFQEVVSKIFARLAALDLTLDTSVNAILIQQKSLVLAPLSQNEKGVKNQKQSKKEKLSQEEKRKKLSVLLKFVWIFLQAFPLAFAAMLLVISLAMPKEVFMYFSENLLIVSMIYSVCIGIGNLAYYLIRKNKLIKKHAAAFLSLFGLGMANILLFMLSFYAIPAQMSITSQKELSTLLNHASHGSFVLEEDIALDGEWRPNDFRGTFNGNGKTISGLSTSFFKENSGNVENLSLVLQVEQENISGFGGLAVTNSGRIKNCSVSGSIKLKNARFAGSLVGQNSGEILNCIATADLQIDSQSNLTAGGLVAENLKSRHAGKVFQCAFEGNIAINATAGNDVVGGLIGKDSAQRAGVTECFANAQISVSGQARTLTLGGLIGEGTQASQNNYALGSITAQAREGYVGGLYGKYTEVTASAIEKCYCVSEIYTDLVAGAFIGQLAGSAKDCFAEKTSSLPFEGAHSGFWQVTNSLVTVNGYDSSFGFDSAVWNLGMFPTLFWQES